MSNTVSNIPDEDRKSSLIILEYSKYCHSHESDQFDKLDSKSATLAGFTGIIIALSTSLTGILFSEESSILTCSLENWIIILLKIFFVLVLTLLLISFFFFIQALRLRNVDDIMPISKLIFTYKNLGTILSRRRKLTKLIIKNISKSEKSIRAQHIQKSQKIKIGTTFLLLSIIVSFISFVFVIINIF